MMSRLERVFYHFSGKRLRKAESLLSSSIEFAMCACTDRRRNCNRPLGLVPPQPKHWAGIFAALGAAVP